MNHKAIIEAVYQAFREKDYETFVGYCQPDVVWIQNPGFPRGATHRGPRAVVANVLQSLNNQWAWWKYEVEKIVPADEDTVLVLGAYRGEHEQTGRQFHSDAAHVYTLKDGKIQEFRQFADTKPIWDALPA